MILPAALGAAFAGAAFAGAALTGALAAALDDPMILVNGMSLKSFYIKYLWF